MNLEHKTISREIVYRGKIVDVARDVVQMPNEKECIREVVLHHGASAVLPVDDQGRIIFVKQYRHPAKEIVYEIPAGTLEQGEEPLQCAIRELEEETGFKTTDFTFITKMYSAIGFCDEILYLYMAKNLQQGRQNLDPDEFISLAFFSLEESVRMVFDGILKDSKSIVAVLAYKEMLNKIPKTSGASLS